MLNNGQTIGKYKTEKIKKKDQIIHKENHGGISNIQPREQEGSIFKKLRRYASKILHSAKLSFKYQGYRKTV